MHVLDFVTKNAATIGLVVSAVNTIVVAFLGRKFQIAMSTYPMRLETTREAVRRVSVVQELTKQSPSWRETMKEMATWHRMNEPFLTPAASEAFTHVLLHTGFANLVVPDERGKCLRDAHLAQQKLQREFRRFGRRSLVDILRDGWRGVASRMRKRRRQQERAVRAAAAAG